MEQSTSVHLLPRPVRLGFFALLVAPILLSGVIGADPLASVYPGVVWPSLATDFAFFATVAYLGASANSAFEWDLRKTHIVQALAQTAFLIAWGLAFPQVFVRFPLVLNQLFLAFALQALVDHFRHRRIRLGFAVVPMVLSLNFFLWFKPEYYWANLVLVAIGVLGKNFVTGGAERKGRHLFNPSGLPMALASYLLALLHVSGISRESYFIAPATMNLVPGMPFLLAVISLFPQALGRTVTIAAGSLIGYLFAWKVLHLYSPFVDVSTYLAICLLVTDPATSPRRPLAQLAYGFAYFLSIAAGELWLGAIAMSGFFAKVLFLPVLNLLAPWFDRISLPRSRPVSLPWFAPYLLYGILVVLLTRNLSENGNALPGTGGRAPVTPFTFYFPVQFGAP